MVPVAAPEDLAGASQSPRARPPDPDKDDCNACASACPACTPPPEAAFACCPLPAFPSPLSSFAQFPPVASTSTALLPPDCAACAPASTKSHLAWCCDDADCLADPASSASSSGGGDGGARADAQPASTSTSAATSQEGAGSDDGGGVPWEQMMLLDDNCAACANGQGPSSTSHAQSASSFTLDPCCGLPSLPSWATAAASCDEPGCAPGTLPPPPPPDDCPTCVVGGLGLITNDGQAVHAQPQPTMALHGELPGGSSAGAPGGTAAAASEAAEADAAASAQASEEQDGLEGLLHGLDEKTIQDIVRRAFLFFLAAQSSSRKADSPSLSRSSTDQLLLLRLEPARPRSRLRPVGARRAPQLAAAHPLRRRPSPRRRARNRADASTILDPLARTAPPPAAATTVPAAPSRPVPPPPLRTPPPSALVAARRTCLSPHAVPALAVVPSRLAAFALEHPVLLGSANPNAGARPRWLGGARVRVARLPRRWEHVRVARSTRRARARLALARPGTGAGAFFGVVERAGAASRPRRGHVRRRARRSAARPVEPPAAAGARARSPAPAPAPSSARPPSPTRPRPCARPLARPPAPPPLRRRTRSCRRRSDGQAHPPLDSSEHGERTHPSSTSTRLSYLDLVRLRPPPRLERRDAALALNLISSARRLRHRPRPRRRARRGGCGAAGRAPPVQLARVRAQLRDDGRADGAPEHGARRERARAVHVRVGRVRAVDGVRERRGRGRGARRRRVGAQEGREGGQGRVQAAAEGHAAPADAHRCVLCPFPLSRLRARRARFVRSPGSYPFCKSALTLCVFAHRRPTLRVRAVRQDVLRVAHAHPGACPSLLLSPSPRLPRPASSRQAQR